MSTYNSNKVPVDKLANSIEQWIEKQQVHEYFKNMFEIHEVKWRNDINQNHWKNSTVRKLLQVHERIKFTDYLSGQISEEFMTRLYFPQLITYLRLTCFDQLGQPATYSNFPNWLKSKKVTAKSEKERIKNEITTNDPIQIALHLQMGYQEIYGSKNSFFNFINSVISLEQKSTLMDSIKIRIEEKLNSGAKVRHATNDEKSNFIYKIRNDFTHNTFNNDPIAKPKKKELEWNFRGKVYVNKYEHWISTRNDFPEILKETVLNGISQRIKQGYGM